MSRGYRLAIIALGLTLFAYQGHSQEAEETALESQPVAEERQSDGASCANDGAEDYSQLAERIAGELVGIKAAIRDLVAEIGAPESAEEKQRGDRDLQAQEDMAYWAKWMFLATLGTIVIAGVGIYYVRKTLMESRRIGQAQVRAYIGIKSADIYFTSELAIPIVEITAVNTGQSPTTEFSWALELQYHADGEGVLRCPPEGIDRPDIDIGATEAPKLMPAITRKFALVEQIAKWKHEPEKVGVSVIIHFRWRDVFGETWEDQASFFGIGQTRDAKINRTEIHHINSSPWFCKLNRIAKGTVRPDLAVGVKKLRDEDEDSA